MRSVLKMISGPSDGHAWKVVRPEVISLLSQESGQAGLTCVIISRISICILLCLRSSEAGRSKISRIITALQDSDKSFFHVR